MQCSIITVNTVFHLVRDNIAFEISQPEYLGINYKTAGHKVCIYHHLHKVLP